MEPDTEGSEDDLVLQNFQVYKIAGYREWAAQAREDGDYERAEELYERARREIEVYRQNIDDIEEKATLDRQDRRNLEDMRDDLDSLERGIDEQLNALH